MSLFDIFSISGSGMAAQNVRINTTASNIANANSVAGSAEDAYKARQPIFAAEIQNQMNRSAAGVGVISQGVTESQAENPMRYEPGHPSANEDGYIFGSNVNMIEEMTNMISASRSYQNNVEVLNTSKQLMMQTLRLGQ